MIIFVRIIFVSYRVNKQGAIMPKLIRSNSQKDYENNLKDGTCCGEDREVDYIKHTALGGKNSVFPLFQGEVIDFEYEFLKSYLFILDSGRLQDKRLKIKNFSAMGTISHPVIIPPLVTSADESGKVLIDNDIIYALVNFDGSDYQVTVFLKLMLNYGHESTKHFISVLGIQPDSFKTKELSDYLRAESVRHSYYKNKVLSMSVDEQRLDIQELSTDEFAGEGLEQIYVPDAVKNELQRFCSCVEHYNRHRLGLRFLLCGEPGTGKTKSVRAIINACLGKATVLYIQGEIIFKKLFKFAELLQPCIICLDDFDLIVGSRDNRFSPRSLGAFLQELDGFRKNDIFILATTNDKELIDKAASRPGRFDLVIDFSRLDKNNYFDLIQTNCIDERVLSVFDDKFMNELRKKRVTGAFITNLIKQLEIKNQINPDEDLQTYANNLIELSYQGFYKKKQEKEMSFGFNGHDD